LLSVIGAVSLLGFAAPPLGVSADDGHDDESSVNVLLDGLNSPKGLALNLERNLVVGQGAFGPPTDPVLVYVLRGPDKGTTFPVTGPASLIDVAISPLDGTGWGISAAVEDPPTPALLLHQLADGSVDVVLDIFAYQGTDPDPTDQDDLATESNPYGLTIDKNGDALFTDAANNDLVRVTPDGHATTVARFDLESIATDHLPADFPGGPFPPELTAEAVPTTVTVGPDGALYVGELKGFPFRPGTSRIWRIKPGAVGATCSMNAPDPTRGCKLYSSGFTAIHDIAFNKRTGRLYVYELAAEGVLAFEEGFGTGVFPSAVLLEVEKGHRHGDDDRQRDGRKELAAGELSQPGGVVVDKNGAVYVTDGMFTGGRLLKVVERD
jgi:hypothetical protein